MSGHDEVIMLRRLSEDHKKDAMRLLTSNPHEPDEVFDGPCKQPHSDGLVSASLSKSIAGLIVSNRG